MAGDYILEDSVAAAPARFEKPLRVFITIALLCLCVKLVWLLGITPFRPFNRIDISGYAGIDRSIILQKAGITSSLSFFTANVTLMEEALMGLGIFETVRVFKHFPSRLLIVLDERNAVAQALATIDGRTVPVLLDRQGVVFGIGDFNPALSAALPVISGIVIEEPFPGMRLPALFIPLFAELDKIMLSTPELLRAVSELRVNRRLFDGYDLTLYPVHGRTRVRLSELNEDLLRYTFLMLDVLTSNPNNIGTLDFRSGIASYIPEGGTL